MMLICLMPMCAPGGPLVRSRSRSRSCGCDENTRSFKIGGVVGLSSIGFYRVYIGFIIGFRVSV